MAEPDLEKEPDSEEDDPNDDRCDYEVEPDEEYGHMHALRVDWGDKENQTAPVSVLAVDRRSVKWVFPTT